MTMHEFDLAYLAELVTETNFKREQFAFFEPNEEGAQITYLPSKQKLHWAGLIDTPEFRYEMDKYDVCEKPTLRKGSQNYFRFVRKDGKLLRIDSYVSGRIDNVLIVHYEGNRRYCFPFSKNGGYYPTYVQVVTFENGMVTESYKVRGIQIVHNAYRQLTDDTTQLRQINYAHGGMYPVICKSMGYYTLGDKMTYTETYTWSYCDPPEEG